MIRAGLAGLALLCGGAAHAPALAQRAPDYSRCTPDGGNIEDCRQLALVTSMRKGIVPLGSVCASGCTMQLSAPNICVRRDIVLRVHAAKFTPTGAIDRPGNETLLAHYRRYPKFIARVKRDRALERFTFTDYTAAELARLGVPVCRS